MRVLDIGCGYFKASGAVGVDLSPDSDADFVEDAEESQRFNGQFDRVIMRHVLEHSNGPRLIRAACRFLRPGGMVYVETPNAYDFVKIVRLFQQGWYSADPGHVQTFGVFELVRLLENNGFHVLRYGYLKLDRHYGVSHTLKSRVRGFVVLLKPQFNDGLWAEAVKV